LGTIVEMRVSGLPLRAARTALERAFAAVARVHALMSPLEPTSDVAQLNRSACGQPVRVDPWTYRVLLAAFLLSDFSEGAFDITVFPCSKNGGRPPTKGNWCDIVLLSDHRVRFARPLRIDLGGIAKGFAVDRAIEILREAGAGAGIVNAGGDLRAFGPTPERIHVRHPARPHELIAATELVEEAMATSANYFDTRGAGRLLRPGGRRLWLGRGSVSVRAQNCLLADALCKVVAAVGPRRSAPLLQTCSASALVLTRRGRLYHEDLHAA
ncbi:MAG: FAD:protein FMN transferase, partial [Verrucomicrobiota bacterium]|nr:FAD:protein FMN transferase [Verrucomicrobiota bacterium]